MVKQLKKLLPIFLATLLGGVIVAIAVKGGSIFGTTVSFTAPKEADNSWKSTLSIVPGNKSITRVEKGTIKEDLLSSATTTTDTISRKLILEYTTFQKMAATSTLSDADADTIATSLVQQIELPLGTEYNLSDLNISSDNSDASIATYIKGLTAIMQSFLSVHKTNELDIVNDAITNKDAQKLQALNPILAQYENLKKDLLTIKTPPRVAPLHLRLIQSYSNIQSSIIAMQKVFSDSIQGLVGITQYQKEIAVLSTLDTEYLKYTPTN